VNGALSSTVTVLASSSAVIFLAPAGPKTRLAEKAPASGSARCWSEAATPVAVSGVPSPHASPSRRVNVALSAVTSHFSARDGSTTTSPFSSPGLTRTSVS